MVRIQSKRKKRIDIAESGALSDLAFLLIIFFIVIAVFHVNFGFLFGLPEQKSTRIVQTEELMRVTIRSDGSFVVKETTLSEQALRDAVTQKRRQYPNMTLLVRVDPESEYQAVVALIDLARGLDIDNFAFRMDETP